MITSFDGEHRFLSNFYPSPIFGYPTVEHAYQASKTIDPVHRKEIRALHTAAQAKRFGRVITLRPNWEAMKLEVMDTLVREKFIQHPELMRQLVATGSVNLVEGNYWHDNFWGCCTCTRCQFSGHNHLGMILMRIREEL